MNAANPTSAGFFGKLQSHGDFITRNLPSAFIAAWDPWLQESLATSKEQLGDTWLETYLSSPIWHFALAGGLCGPAAYAGVLMPSVDRVGRYFPLTLAAPLAAGVTPVQALENDHTQWFQRAEQLALSTLAEGFDFSNFETQLQGLGTPLSGNAGQLDAMTVGVNSHGAIHVAMPPGGGLEGAYARLSNYALGALYSTPSLWWTAGSERVVPSLMACRGLPPTPGFSAFLDGAWGRWGWRQYPESPPTGTSA